MVFWENIKIFYLVVVNGGFKATAQSLRINVSSISRRITSLEQELQQKLFINKKKMFLTTSGQKIFDYIHTSCDRLINLSNNSTFSEEEAKIIIYISDVYFYHLLKHHQHKGSPCSNLNIANISTIDNNVIQELVNSDSSNFVYISNENHKINNKNYMYLPIFNIPLFMYENNNGQDCFWSYMGNELWLKKLHEQHINANKYHKIISSNSIDLMTQLISLGGKSILPPLINSDNSSVKKLYKVGEQKLFCLFHVKNIHLKSLFT
jgi:hypothetical protein